MLSVSVEGRAGKDEMRKIWRIHGLITAPFTPVRSYPTLVVFRRRLGDCLIIPLVSFLGTISSSQRAEFETRCLPPQAVGRLVDPRSAAGVHSAAGPVVTKNI